MLKKRVITALVLIPLMVAAVWFDQPLPWLAIFVSVWGVLAALEFYRIVASSGSRVSPLTGIGLAWTLFFILSPLFDYAYLNEILLTSAVVLPLLWLLSRRQQEGAFLSWAWTLAGIFYVGWLLGHFVALRELEFGREWVLLALFITFASDSAAYFVGRAWGRHRLAPAISPKKTREGALGGVLAAIAAGPLLVLILDLPISYAGVIPLALAISILGQAGDLIESLFKRNMGVKESGNTLPGHGGFLDRMDSVVFAGVAVYYYVVLLNPGG
ncbi:MAG: phosphatidate cytidylyltransferase [Dehalococcoidales bacterium]|nr:phosphatidate cytidylyltransferase [Dehalococcoidales bacterium]